MINQFVDRVANGPAPEVPVIANLPPTWMARRMVPPAAVEGADTIKRKRAAVYLRYSTSHQDPYSFERQLARAREYAESIGADIVVVYGDAGESGAFTVNRQGYLDMMAAAARHEFDIVIIEEGDRLSRKLHITANSYNTLRELRIELHSSKVGVWSLLHVAFHGLISEEQRLRITELMRSGLVKIVQRGLWPGRPPYAYEKVSGVAGEMIVNQERAKIVKRIYAMRLDNLTHSQIAQILHDEGVEPPVGAWTESVVAYILRNPIYVGALLYFKSKGTKRELADGTIELTRTMQPTTQWKVSERPDWAIVDALDWQKVQEMGRENRQTGPNSAFLLSRMVFCGACGQRAHATAKKPNGRMSMRCNANEKIRRLKATCAPCDQKGILLDLLEDAVIRVVCERLDMPQALESMQAAYERAVKERFDEFNKGRTKLINERAKIVGRLDATYDASMVAGLTTTVVREQRIALCNRIEEIDGKLASMPLIALDQAPLLSAPVDAAAFLSELSPMRNYRNAGESLAKLRAIFRRLVEKVTVSTDKDSGKSQVRIEGPISHVDGKDSIEITIEPDQKNFVLLRKAHAEARAGVYSLTDPEWEKIKDRLPVDPIWSEEFDEPLPFRAALDALIFLKLTRVGPGNLDDTYGPRRQVWSALRMLNFAGILDLAQEVMQEADIVSAKGLKFGFDSARTKKPNRWDRYVEWNERRRQRVLAKLEGSSQVAR